MKMCEDQLAAGELLIPDVPYFTLTLPCGPSDVRVANKEVGDFC